MFLTPFPSFFFSSHLIFVININLLASAKPWMTSFAPNGIGPIIYINIMMQEDLISVIISPAENNLADERD